ncbi:MAG TPA: SH3 domain-containing protein [Aggregatilinea sp.]|uniref:SH3 domain-containing protein n=1 Tax=Aggregatilinea sp. TaxID=2806333 RepID=UPI002C13A5DC|nr:hypothetical protein [Aggregatilinea sp.]HML21873.1 SH3 domain-containing protein [Aggregatilinea sp.]
MKGFTRFLVGFVILALLLVELPFAVQPVAAQGGTCTVEVVASPRLNLRAGPGTSYAVKRIINDGTLLTATAFKRVGSDLWATIQLSDGSAVWGAVQYAGETLISVPDTDACNNILPAATASCTGITRVYLNVRSSYSTASAVIRTLTTNVQITVAEKQAVGSNTWYRITSPVAGWVAGLYAGETYITLGTGEACDPYRTLPAAIPSRVATPKTGLHLIYGAQAGPVLAAVRRGAVGTIKGTTLTENIIKQVEAERPGTITVWRSTHTLAGAADCPTFAGDPRDAATQWWSWQYISWQQAGLVGVVDYFEVTNECLGDQAWFTQFTLRLEELANNAGICLLMFSDAPGNPALLTDWQTRKPALDYALAHPCQSGRTHGIAQHVYGINPGVVPTATGAWIFGRHHLILGLISSKYAALPWYFSEWGVGNGRGPVDCGALQTDVRKALSIYNGESEVMGFAVWNVGGNPSSATDWTDITACLGGL